MTELKCPVCGGNLENAIMSLKVLGCPKCHIFGCVELYERFADTKKKLDICEKALNKIANTDIKVIEREPLYYARAMFSVANNVLNRIQDIEQINKKEEK